MQLLHRWRNAVDYPLRQFFHWRRGGLVIRQEPKDGAFDGLPPAERAPATAQAAALVERYRLEPFRDASTRHNYRLTLFYLELLERACEATSPSWGTVLAAVDIGPSHWFYVQGQHALLRWWRAPAGRAVTLDAHELDAWRVYPDLRSRYDHALAHIRGLPGVTYHPTAFEPAAAAYDVVFMLFPFVFVGDHRRWGLPDRLFDPADLLAAAWTSVKPGGALIVVNQGEAEHEAQKVSFESAGIPVTAAFRHDSLLFQHQLPRYALTARREPGDRQP